MPSSVHWSERHVLHKQGVIGVTLATLLFVIGYSVPAWTTSQLGLWMWCSADVCSTNVVSHNDTWMHVVRGLECLALLAFIVCILVEVMQDFYLTVPPSRRNKTVEILAFLAGFLGIAGAVIFAIQKSEDVIFNTPTPQTPPHLHEDHNSKLQWGFALVVTASIIAILSAVAIGYSRCKHDQPTATKISLFPSPARVFAGENVSFGDCHDVDSSSMMLVPAGHNFETKSSPSPRHWGRDPPPYALPPPYPYTSNYDFFLPMANSSMVPQIAGSTSLEGQNSSSHRRHNNAQADPSFPTTDSDTFSTPTHSFASPVSSTNDVSHHRPMMQPLYVKTSHGGSHIEITPSAQNSTGLPSPFNHF
ncbi:uncharacterized protein [Littorina saxatilis]|uniref:Transmembrane protein n=1 Tax=Littorina saxatilis TaxID=31220 RepID=A0AAN9BX06_9CAEN